MEYGALLQLAIGLYGEQQAKHMTRDQLKLLERQLSDIRGVQLPTLPELQAEELGPSNVGGMVSDEALRGKQLQALAEIQNIIDSGGLDLSDKASLEEAMAAASNQQRRARAGVADDAAQRGQLNSGARLAMDMDAAQQGANAARATGMQTAGMAQRRRLQAIQESARMAGGMRENDWREKEASARAKDIRDERNAAARESAARYNAGLPQQGFTNAMAKATGQQPAVGAVGNALAAGAVDARQSAGGLAGAVGALPAYSGSTGGGGGAGPRLPSDDPNYTYKYGHNFGESDPDEWDKYPG